MEKKIPSRIRRKRNIKIKKSTIGLFAMMFAFVFAVFHVFAGENNTISAETKSANRGDTVNLKVNLECSQEYNSALVELSFDTDVLEYVRTNMATTANPAAVAADPDNVDPITFLAPAPNGAQDVADANSNGKVSLGYAIDGEVACEDIQMASVRFKVKDDAPYGNSPVTVSAIMAKEVGGVKTNLTVDTVDGAVVLALPVDIDSVELEEENITVQKGQTGQITVNYSPTDTTDNKTVTYSGYDEDIITISETGQITGVAVGNTDVTVTAFGKTMTAHVTVENHVSSVTVNGDNHNIEKDDTLELSAVLLPADATEVAAGVTWESSSPGIASVDSNGVVTGHANGSATIIATSSNGISGTFTVNVVVPITSFALDNSEDANMIINKNASRDIEYTILPEDTSESTVVTWTSSDESVALVSNGVISAVGKGTATITGSLGQTKNNIEPIVINVTVFVPLTSITLDKENLELLPTQEYQLQPTIDPSDATNQTITWTSSVPGVATVDENGKVTAVADGTTVIKARIEAEDKEDTVTLHVLKPVTGATINKPEVTLNGKNATDTLSVTVTPDGAEEQYTVTWASADPSKVTVDENGKITAVAGTTTPVKVTGVLNTLTPLEVYSMVTVNIPLNDISLNKTSETINKGDELQLSVTYDPSDTTDNKTVTWSNGGSNSVVTVDENGKVTAVGKGVATVTATVGTHSKSCQITVNVPVSSVEINSADFELARTKTKDLDATINPGDASVETVTWSSSNPSIASVDSNGVVTAVAKGTATITAAAGGKEDTVKVTVTAPITAFTTPEASKTILRKSSVTIPTTIEPSDTTDDTTITWTSANDSIATVDSNGKVTGVGEGTVKITGKITDDWKVEVMVTVQIVPVESITASESHLDMNRKDTKTLTVTYSPTNATEVEDVTWTTSTPEIVSVDDNGKVTALKEGNGVVTAHMGALTADVTVTVTEIPLEGVSLEDNATETEVGKPYQIVPKLEPFNATDDVTFTYESSDPEVATVDENGKVTTKKAGTVTITIKASNGVEEYEDTIEITVKAPSSPQTGVTPIRVYGGIIAILLVLAVVIYKRKELF